MKVIVCASSKGGSGKTSIAACLAMQAVSEGHSVYLLDLDPQESAMKWWRRAGGPDNPMMVVGIENLSRALYVIGKKGIERDYLLVDTPGSFMNVISDAVMYSHAVAIVAQPSPKDLESLDAVERMVRQHNRKDRVLYVLNRCGRNSMPFEASVKLADRSLYPPMMIADRVSYARADAQGLTAPAIDKDAAEEIGALWVALKGIANDSRQAKPVGSERGGAGKPGEAGVEGGEGGRNAGPAQKKAKRSHHQHHAENLAGREDVASRTDA